MSEMGQEMETWLKKECYDVGRNLLWASKALDTAIDSSLDLEIPERADVARSIIETTVNYAQIVTQRLPWELFTAEDREKISKARDDIIISLKQDSPKITLGKVARLTELIDQYLLEKVVECQCGKPGGSSSNPGGDKLAELKDEIRKQIQDEQNAFSEYRALAAKFRHIDKDEIATIIDNIANDESEHKSKLGNILRELGD